MKSERRRFIPAGLAILVVATGGGSPASASAPAGRYTININADTVVDTVTGLTWQRTISFTPTYTWDGSASPASGSAQYYCNTLSHGGIGAGGWRLPRKLELESIIDYEAYDPAIDTNAFPNTPYESQEFWSSSRWVGGAGYAWAVPFNQGTSYWVLTSTSFNVRCVH